MENENDSKPSDMAEKSEKPNKKEELKKKLTKLAEIKVNSEDFICEIEKRSELWDCRSKEYCDKTVKLKAWHDIVVVFFPDFEEVDLSSKNLLVEVIQKRWKSIRTCYAREVQKKKEVRSGSRAKSNKQYVYYEQLSFLETLCNKTASTLDDNYDRDNTVEENNDNTEATGLVQNKGIAKSQGKRRNTLKKDEDELIDILKRKIATEEEEKQDEKHEDKLFLLSLLSEINKVLPERKLKLRSDIIAAVSAAQTPITQQWPPMPNTGQFGYQEYSSQPQPYQNFVGYSYQAQHNQRTNHQQHPSQSYLNPTGFSNQIQQYQNPTPSHQHTSTPVASPVESDSSKTQTSEILQFLE